MKTDLSRRSFISQGSRACISCCLMMRGSRLMATAGPDKNIPDPKELTYCGYKCTPECPLLKATLDNDIDLKRKTFEEWGIEDKHGIEFDAEVYFCHGCKNEDQPKGFPVQHCSIIPCAQGKGFDCCIQCKELSECSQVLWETYPDHRKYVLDLQKTYFATLE